MDGLQYRDIRGVMSDELQAAFTVKPTVDFVEKVVFMK
jgi:hypothetical protein